MADDFVEVVWTGTATKHVRDQRFSGLDLARGHFGARAADVKHALG